VWLTPNKLNPRSKFYNWTELFNSTTCAISRVYWLKQGTTKEYRRFLNQKDEYQISKDRQLIEAIGFPVSINGVAPTPNFHAIQHLLEDGARLDHFVPEKNKDSDTWHIVNAFKLATKNTKADQIIALIFKYCKTWNYSHTITKNDLISNIQMRSFLRLVYGTPLGVSFEYALEKHWQVVIRNRSCINPILDFLRFSRRDDAGNLLNSKSVQLSQLQEIANNYNFGTTLKEDLRLMDEFTDNGHLPHTISATVQNNLKLVLHFITLHRPARFLENVIGLVKYVLNVMGLGTEHQT